MTLFLRNKQNETIVDIEINNGKDGIDVSVATIITTYSKLLLENLERKDEIIEDFGNIDELRGWFWEVYMNNVSAPILHDVTIQIKNKLLPIAEKYKLNYIVD